MYNASANWSSDEPPTEYELPVSPYSLPVKVVLLILSIAITAAAIVGNALIITAFFTTPRLRRLTNYFYVSLAITDLTAGILVMPYMVSYTILFYWKFGKPFCVFWLCVDMFVYSSSVYHMCVICLDRFLAIRFPFMYRIRRTRKLVITLLITAWALGLAFEVPVTILYEHIAGESVIAYEEECDVEWVENAPVTIVSFIVTVIIPFLFTLILYVHIFVTIRRSHRYSITTESQTNTADKKEAGRLKSSTLFACMRLRPRFDRNRTESDQDKSVADQNAESIQVTKTKNERAQYTGFNFSLCKRLRNICCFHWKHHSYNLNESFTTNPLNTQKHKVIMVGFQQRALTDISEVQSEGRLRSLGMNSTTVDFSTYNEHTTDTEKDVSHVFPSRYTDQHSDINKNTNSILENSYSYVNKGMTIELEDVSITNIPFIHNKTKGTNTRPINEKDETVSHYEQEARKNKSFETRRTEEQIITTTRVNKTMKKKEINGNENYNCEKDANRRRSKESLMAKQKAKERRAAATLGILLGVFLITWLPWKITTIADSFAQKYLFPDLWYEFAIWLQYSNSMINPFLYIFRDKHFRIAVRGIICRFLCRKHVGQNSSSSSGQINSRRPAISHVYVTTSEF
ncbi:muscarinic acetylcholine receptor gar-3-like [Saccoglossus kowalevskii]|uniref:Muscarinic acetylcholine receptor gar-3-like n=1 Tax=Saccoglossus kowalevskii TaxID=10224 RepID=A0ABM0MWI1_SACKO|nr:PREDICTED: muscarinic acetylcholine receptor gar-3-like [Saccoglossus kowalevskii]